MTKRIVNFTNKPITEFNESDTLYISKNANGFQYIFLVKFMKIERGVVYGTILDIQPNNISSIWIGKDLLKINGVMKAKISSCFTFDQSCRWFKKENNNWFSK